MPGQTNFLSVTVPAPSGGQDMISPIDNMDPYSALGLKNFFSNGQTTSLRNGYIFRGQVGNNEPSPPTNDGKLGFLAVLPAQNRCLFDNQFADDLVSGDSSHLYDMLDFGNVEDITGTTTPTRSDWQWDTFNNHLFLCNGVDNVQIYDGESMVDSDLVGIDPTFINVAAFKQKLYFVKKNTFETWYSTNDGDFQSPGTLTKLDLKYFFQKGGVLLFAGSWTNQNGITTRDLFFFCSSEGEILFYNGLNPGDTATPWGLVARYVIGKPLGYRAFVRVNNDVWILTQQGIVPISELFALDPQTAANSISRKINLLISQYAKLFPFSSLWQGVHWPGGRRVYITVPTSNSGCQVIVYSQDAQGWFPYKWVQDTDCTAIAVADEIPYMVSSDGYLYEIESGFSDRGNTPTDYPIAYSGRLAFSFFGNRGNFKVFKDIRPLFRSVDGVSMNMSIDTNFQQRTNPATIEAGISTFTAWGSPWGSPWSGPIDYLYDRFSLNGQGTSGSVKFSGSLKNSPLELFGFEVRFENGSQV